MVGLQVLFGLVQVLIKKVILGSLSNLACPLGGEEGGAVVVSY